MYGTACTCERTCVAAHARAHSRTHPHTHTPTHTRARAHACAHPSLQLWDAVLWGPIVPASPVLDRCRALSGPWADDAPLAVRSIARAGEADEALQAALRWLVEQIVEKRAV